VRERTLVSEVDLGVPAHLVSRGTARLGAERRSIVDRPERRVSRDAPRARLRAGWLGFYPTLLPDTWYALHTEGGNHPSYLWLETSHGITRVQRSDLEVKDGV
jgi:hypothetical protein